MPPIGRRTLLRSWVGASLGLLAGCSGSSPEEDSVTTTRSATTETESAVGTETPTETTPGRTTADTTTDAGPPPGARLPVTVHSDEAGDVLTTDRSPTADCAHAAALATDAGQVEQFDWADADDAAREFARATDFETACLLAVRTTSPGPVEYEVDWVARETGTTLRVHTTARAVPGPSTRDADTRLARVGLDGGPTPSRAVVVRTTDYDDSWFAFATDDRTCPGE